MNVLQMNVDNTRVGTLIGATIYLQLIQNSYVFRSFTVLQCSHQHCVQPVASDVEVELSTQQALLKVSYDFHIADNGLYTMLVTTLKESKTSKHVSILYQL